MSRSCHTHHEHLILVIRVTNASFAIESHLRKSVDNDITYEENFPASKILVSFYFLIWGIHCKLSYKKLCKKQFRQL